MCGNFGSMIMKLTCRIYSPLGCAFGGVGWTSCIEIANKPCHLVRCSSLLGGA